MDEEKFITTSLRVDKELWKNFKMKCAAESVNLTVGIDISLRNWVFEEEK